MNGILSERNISVILYGNIEKDLSMLNWSSETGKNGKLFQERGKTGLVGED